MVAVTVQIPELLMREGLDKALTDKKTFEEYIVRLIERDLETEEDSEQRDIKINAYVEKMAQRTFTGIGMAQDEFQVQDIFWEAGTGKWESVEANDRKMIGKRYRKAVENVIHTCGKGTQEWKIIFAGKTQQNQAIYQRVYPDGTRPKKLSMDEVLAAIGNSVRPNTLPVVPDSITLSDGIVEDERRS